MDRVFGLDVTDDKLPLVVDVVASRSSEDGRDLRDDVSEDADFWFLVMRLERRDAGRTAGLWIGGFDASSAWILIGGCGISFVDMLANRFGAKFGQVDVGFDVTVVVIVEIGVGVMDG